MILQKGDTIGIIALSGDLEEEQVNNAENYIKSLGYKVRLSKNILDKKMYLAGNDKIKIECLQDFCSSSEIKLILAARGGYGAIRLVNDIDYNIIKNNPKPICGFSDTTAILLMIHKMTGIETYHSPMACTDFSKYNPFNEDFFFKALSGKEMNFESFGKTYNVGTAKGILWGGNLSTVVSLCGIDFLPDNNFIFFTEDLNEPVYKIDRMFQQLFNIEQFKNNCKGIVLGDFLGVDNIEWLDKYFEELSIRFDIPISSGFKITHSDEKITLPIGRQAILDNNILRVLHA